MQLAEIMQKDVRVTRPESTVQEAAREMSRHGIGSLVVVGGSGNVAGIVTDSDIIKDVVAEGLDETATKVSEIMTSEVVAATPEMSLEEAADLMQEHNIKHLPIVHEGALVGIVTATDLIAYEDALIEKISNLLLARHEVSDVGG